MAVTVPNSIILAQAVGLAKIAREKALMTPIGTVQKKSRSDPGPKPDIWAVPVVFPVPPDSTPKDIIYQAFAHLAEPGMVIPKVDAAPIVAEWIGFKKSDDSGVADTPESRFAALNRDVASDRTILYIKGGMFHRDGLAQARPSATKLSKAVGCRVVALDCRLAPQNPFPSQLLDIFIAYLSLLWPRHDSLHKPIPASSIVLACESSGAIICLALIQLILHLGDRKIRYLGRTTSVPLPAGLSIASGAGESCQGLPSWKENLHLDLWGGGKPGFLDPKFPPDEVWPSNPPRGNLYSDQNLMHHPLVSPAAALSWEGAPPMWFGTGQDCLYDSVAAVAQTAYKDGVSVLWDGYESMPHIWMLWLPKKLPQVSHVYKRWADACKNMFEKRITASKGTHICIDRLEESPLDLAKLVPFGPREVREIIVKACKDAPVYTGKGAVARL